MSIVNLPEGRGVAAVIDEADAQTEAVGDWTAAAVQSVNLLLLLLFVIFNQFIKISTAL